MLTPPPRGMQGEAAWALDLLWAQVRPTLHPHPIPGRAAGGVDPGRIGIPKAGWKSQPLSSGRRPGVAQDGQRLQSRPSAGRPTVSLDLWPSLGPNSTPEWPPGALCGLGEASGEILSCAQAGGSW